VTVDGRRTLLHEEAAAADCKDSREHPPIDQTLIASTSGIAKMAAMALANALIDRV